MMIMMNGKYWHYNEILVHEHARWVNDLKFSMILLIFLSLSLSLSLSLLSSLSFFSHSQRCVTIGHSNEIHPSMIHSYYSRTSDTSSAYSGSDLMQSSTNGEDSLINQQHETDDESEESSEVSESKLIVSPFQISTFVIELHCSIHFPFTIIFAKHLWKKHTNELKMILILSWNFSFIFLYVSGV